jgi:hypothetical protein
LIEGLTSRGGEQLPSDLTAVLRVLADGQLTRRMCTSSLAVKAEMLTAPATRPVLAAADTPTAVVAALQATRVAVRVD